MEKRIRITSAEQATQLRARLKSVWSQESVLSQGILIYIAELLEKATKENKAVVRSGIRDDVRSVKALLTESANLLELFAKSKSCRIDTQSRQPDEIFLEDVDGTWPAKIEAALLLVEKLRAAAGER